MDQTIQDGERICVASISLIEIAYLVERSRIPEEAFEQLNQALASKNKFGTILRHFSDQANCQELLIPLGVRVSEPMNFEFRIARH